MKRDKKTAGSKVKRMLVGMRQWAGPLIAAFSLCACAPTPYELALQSQVNAVTGLPMTASFLDGDQVPGDYMSHGVDDGFGGSNGGVSFGRGGVGIGAGRAGYVSQGCSGEGGDGGCSTDELLMYRAGVYFGDAMAELGGMQQSLDLGDKASALSAAENAAMNLGAGLDTLYGGGVSTAGAATMVVTPTCGS